MFFTLSTYVFCKLHYIFCKIQKYKNYTTNKLMLPSTIEKVYNIIYLIKLTFILHL